MAAAAAASTAGSAAAQTPVRVTLDFKFEGPSAPFLVGLDKGYYKAEGLDVTIDPAAGSLEPITRVASGAYDIGFGDINALIRFRDRNPGTPIKAVFMVYNRPPFAIITRKSRGVAKPKDLEGKKLGAPTADTRLRPVEDLREGERHRRRKGRRGGCRHSRARADAGRRPGRCHHRVLVLLLRQPQGSRRSRRRHRGAADGRLRRQSLRQRHHRRPEIRRRASRGGEGIPARLHQGPQGHRQGSRGGGRFRHQAQRRSPRRTSSSNVCAWR